MKRKLHIGVIIGRVYKEINRKIVKGILEQAYSLGYSADVFTYIEENFDGKILRGENNILNLINFSLLDGMIFAPNSFGTDESRDYIKNFLLEKCSVPIVCISEDFPCFKGVWISEREDIACITRHLIEKHGCRNILCLTGPERLKAAQARAKGFIDAMTEAGIPTDENSIVYGDFWVKAAEKLANDIADGNRPMPEAVVCTSDTMASSLCDTLIRRGVSVPDDILITGYDGTWETRSHIPAISTFQPAWKLLGHKAMCMLYKEITGKKCSPCGENDERLFARATCGCVPCADDNNAPDITYQIMEDNYLDSNLSVQLLSSGSLAEFSKTLCGLTYVFMDHVYYEKEGYCLCLCEDWDSPIKYGSSDYRKEGYSENMILVNELNDRIVFPSRDMYPPGVLKHDEPTVTFFTAVHFQDRCFGYAMHTIRGVADGFNLHYLRFCREINNGLMFLCAQNELKSRVYNDYISEIRDTLTGLYNVNALSRLWQEKEEKARIYGEEMFLIAVTVNGVRQIGEMHGRVESERMLASFAEILPQCCAGGEYCLRIGEDGFIVFGSSDSPEADKTKTVNALNEALEQFNQSSGKPYRIKIHVAEKILSGEELLRSGNAEAIVKDLLEESKKAPCSFNEPLYYSELVALRREIYQKPELEWSLKVCSRKLEISLSHFQRLYRAAFGVSCMHDVQSSKLSYAKKLLLNSDDTLQNVAEKCGYDYSHFMRIFKKEFDVTPTEYRNGKTASRRKK